MGLRPARYGGIAKKKEPKRENDPYYITDRGREVLADPPALLDYEYLKRFPEYVAACKNNGSSKTPRDRSKRNGAHDTGARRDPIAEVTNDLKGSTVHTAELTLTSEDSQQTEPSEDKMGAASYSYTIKHIIEEGCFLDQERLREIFKRLKVKKNLILQGPPGTGKTWLAKRLAYALIGSKDQNVTQDRLRMVQFHQSLSYEDFVRGMRPSGADGRLELVDGLFLQIAESARAKLDRPFVLVIEEINRGNPAQIFGELLTLLEDTKRNEEDSFALAYPRRPDEMFHVPPNLYVIGTMNIADRSLALVDLALRRRFAFENLTPQLNGAWKTWCTDRLRMPSEDVSLIEDKINALNNEIEQDRSLGPQYRIGHSYVTPCISARISDARSWFRDLVRTEIVPLLEEYWFDAPDKVSTAAKSLLEGL